MPNARSTCRLALSEAVLRAETAPSRLVRLAARRSDHDHSLRVVLCLLDGGLGSRHGAYSFSRNEIRIGPACWRGRAPCQNST